MMPIKPIRDWRNVFLDTSFIVDIVSNPSRFDKNPLVQARIQNAHQLLNALERTAAEIKRTFFISTMTVTELQKLPTTNRVDKELIQMFNSVDVEFVPYSLQSALALNHRFETLLPDSQQSRGERMLKK